MSLLKRRRPTATREPEGESPAPNRYLSHDELPCVASMNPSPLDLLALNVARCFCHGWSSGRLAAWEHAFEMADDQLGPLQGSNFVARVIALMRALMKERAGGMRYMSVGCTRICEDEEALLRAMQSALNGDQGTLKIAVGELTRTAHPECTYTMLAAQALKAFGHHGAAQQESEAQPRHLLN